MIPKIQTKTIQSNQGRIYLNGSGEQHTKQLIGNQRRTMNVAACRIFPEALRSVGTTLTQIGQGTSPALSQVFQSLLSRTNLLGMDPDYQSLMVQQMQFQKQMQQVSMQSNTSRNEHETRMAIVRNVRVS